MSCGVELEIGEVDVEEVQQFENVLKLAPTKLLLFASEGLEFDALIVEGDEDL